MMHPDRDKNSYQHINYKIRDGSFHPTPFSIEALAIQFYGRYFNKRDPLFFQVLFLILRRPSPDISLLFHPQVNIYSHVRKAVTNIVKMMFNTILNEIISLRQRSCLGFPLARSFERATLSRYT